MYSISSNNVNEVKESFVNLRKSRTTQKKKQHQPDKDKTHLFKCTDTKNIVTNTMMINNTNYLKNLNTDCLIVPSKVFDGGNKNNFILSVIKNDCKDLNCSKSSDHAFQIYPINLLNNTIFIDIIKPTFFSIVNTKNMSPNGVIKLFNTNSKINLIQIADLNNNDETITKLDLDGNICHDPDDLDNNFKFSFSQDVKIQNTTINYINNPVIYFFGDYNACSLEKKNQVNNLFVYLDYGDQKKLTTCLNKMKFNIVKSGNNTKDFKIPFDIHGSQYNDYKSRNFIINFDPRDISTRDGFITIINTKNNIEGFYEDASPDYFVNLYNKFKNSKLSLKDYFKDNIKDFKLADLNDYNLKLNDLSGSFTPEISPDDLTGFVDFIAKLTDIAKSDDIPDDIPVTTSVDKPDDKPVTTPDVVTPNVTTAPQSSAPTLQLKTPKGEISFSKDLINKLIKTKKSCLYVKFWLASFNFIDDKVISVNDKKGPYKQIDFVGNPKIIIYIPPYVINNKNDINRKNAITSLVQENENICDVYINISY
jgi:hypothetical protein